jgi:acyl transferase domain-containing protein
MSDFQKRIENLSPKRLMLLALDLQSRLQEMERQQTEPIAVIGLGCRIPGAEDGPDAFWQLLAEGRNSIREVPGDRWDAAAYYDANIEAPGRMCTKWGGFLSAIDQFDAPFFGIAAREANTMDPQQRILLEVCWEALEHAGHSPRKLAGTATGVFVGICATDYQTMLLARGEEAIDAYLASGTAPSIAAGRISYTLGLQGPSMAIDTACSASLVAVHLACQSLRAGECSMALAGGVNAILSPKTTIALSKAHMMAPDGRCKTFDSRADGFVRSEGCGIVALKRLSGAVADGDHILAVIRGSAVNQDGRSSGMTAPNGTAQEGVIRAALAQAGVQPEEIGYVEAHGTGTSLGDPIEAQALAAVLGPGRSVENPLVVGSVKTNLGHMESAAGIVGLIKVVLALQHEQIPAHLHFEQLNPHINWGSMPVTIPLAGQAWRRGKRRRVAGVSSFGFSGTNAHVIVEEASAAGERKRAVERGQHVLALSARTGKALRQLGERYVAELERGQVDLGDLCYTANAGRAHFDQRLAVTGSTPEEVRSRLLEALPGEPVRARERVRVAFLFPGQGAQYAGMGKELYETQPVFRATLEECAERLRGELDRPLLDVLWGSAAQWLDETVYTQPALFAVEYALAHLWQSWGIEPGWVAGHSVGEYVAACVAGVYSLADGLKLIAGRGRLMQGVSGLGGMAAVWAGEDRVREALRGWEQSVVIAALNGPESVVISGYREELGRVEQQLREKGFRVRRLKGSHGFHSPQMREMEEAFEALAQGVPFARPRLLMISSVTGRVVGPEEMSHAGYWRRQVSEPVRFRQAMESLGEQGSEVFLEVGPGTTLGVLGRETLGEAGRMWLPSLRRRRGECEQTLDSLGKLYVRGAEVNWAGFDKPYARRRMPLPTYPFERQRYWMDGTSPRRTPESRQEGEREIRDRPAQDIPPTDWYYGVSWQSRAAVHAPKGNAAVDRDRRALRRCLIVSDGSGVASELAGRIRERGGKATLANSPDAASAELRSEAYDLVLHLASSTAVKGGLEGDFSNGGGACVSRALKTTQAVLAEERGARLWIVTTGAQLASDRQSTVDVAQAPLWGLGKTFALEHPGSWGGLVDLDPMAPASQSATELLSAIGKYDGEDQVAFRDGKRYVARLMRATAPSGSPQSFAPGKTYLITGGLGALGLKAAAWMASHGARNLVLVGRKAPSEQAAQVIEGLQREGVRVGVYAADVGSAPQIEAVFRKVQDTLPPIGGIIHAAGVLDDGIIAQQTWERFEKVMVPKTAGAWNLHRLTAGIPLEFFVLFSSAASLIGSTGQASYAAANAYLDALACNRRASGLPALSINWGGWADAGMAARVVTQGRRQTEFQLMPPHLALAALSQVLSTGAAQIGIAAVDWPMHKSLHGSQPFLNDLLSETGGANTAGKDAGQQAKQRLRELLSALPNERATRLVQYLVETLAPTLGVEARTIDPSKPVTDYGLDSLMALEFRNRINSELNVAIPTVRFLQGFSLEEVAAQIEAEWPQAEVCGSEAAICGSMIEFPLSFGQQVHWLWHKIMAGSASHNVGLTAKARPGLDWPAFERAVSKLTLRHAALRTIFFTNDADAPMQRILPSPRPDVSLVEASPWGDMEIKEAILQDFQRPFTLDRPMFRVTVFRREDGDVIFFKFDHIIIDHWSVRLCIEDLKKIYVAELAGTEPALAPAGAEYAEFVEWENKAVHGAGSNSLWEYWKQKLGGELPVLRLPSTRQRPAVLVPRGEALPLALTKEHWLGVSRIAREHRATGYSVLLAAFQALLFHYTRQTDIVVGTSVSGRENPRWSNTIGLFMNLLALRGDLSGNPTFAEYLVRTRDTVLEALEHQEFPFSLLVTRLRQPRNLDRIPIFQSFFNFLTDRSGALRSLFMGVQAGAVEFGDSMLHPYMVVPQQEGRPEVGVQLAEMNGQLVGYLNYNCDVLDPATAEAMATDYCRLLDAIIRDSNTPIDDLLPATSVEAPDREEILL